METVRLTEQQSLCIADLPENYRVVGVDRRTPFVRKPTGQLMRIQQNGRLTSATVAATHRVADRRAMQGGRPVAGVTQIDTPPQSDNLTLRLRRLEGTTQAVLATLRRSLVERVPPTRAGLAHEASIAFDLKNDQRALDMIDDVAQTVGIAGLG
jgi:hypothetical protein